ncbi:MAG: hypothetical protein PHW12_00330 [Smithella sp.]|nr:hypothetical protein [Smithella sp.]
MKLSWKIYSILFIVIALSIVFTIVLPAEDIMKYVYSTPGLLALLSILYQLFRDDAKHQKELIVQHDQQAFDLGATTHMADVAFDKHVIFCEEYMEEVQSGASILFREGSSPTGMTLASKLLQIRRKHAVWLTNEIDKKLEPYESAIRKIGASAQYYNNDPAGAVKSGTTDESQKALLKILNLDADNNPDPEIATATIIKRIRDIIGIEGLTNLRRLLISSKRGEQTPLHM